MDLTIRKATKKDYSGVSLLFNELNRLHSEALPRFFITPDPPLQKPDFEHYTSDNKDAVLFVALSDREIIGFIQAAVMIYPPISIIVKGEYANIINICVKPEYRRLSVGKKLIETVERWAIEKGLNQITLNVWDFNKRAMAFFGNTGFKPFYHIMEKNLKNKRN